jgi:hypothetical protein
VNHTFGEGKSCCVCHSCHCCGIKNHRASPLTVACILLPSLKTTTSITMVLVFVILATIATLVNQPLRSVSGLISHSYPTGLLHFVFLHQHPLCIIPHVCQAILSLSHCAMSMTLSIDAIHIDSICLALVHRLQNPSTKYTHLSDCRSNTVRFMQLTMPSQYPGCIAPAAPSKRPITEPYPPI